MARGKLPAQTPLVPQESFFAFDLLYRFLQQLDADLSALEGGKVRVNSLKASTTTLGSETSLRLYMPPESRWNVDVMLVTNGNFKMRHSGPAAPTRVQLTQRVNDAGVENVLLDTAYSAADITCTGAGIIVLSGILHNGTNGGYFNLEWAQAASNVTPTVLYAGSRAVYSRIE